MKAKQFVQFLAILVLILWGGTFVFFYATGRIESHVDVTFRTWSLIAGLGLCVLGFFNLATFQRQEACTHDHGHDDDGHHGHDHDHDCCGHDHDHEHEHDHDHHHHHGHEHHDHDHAHEHEQPVSSVLTAVIILTVPLLMAAHYSKDSFSANYIQKWGKIERQIYQMRLAEQRAARAEQRQAAENAAAATPTPSAGAAAADSPPATTPDGSPATSSPPEDAPKPEAGTTAAADAPPTGDDAASEGEEWGAFTMEDLERMVPKNSEGLFLLDVPQIFYTAGDEELMMVMEGIPVETVAQVMEETLNNPTGTRLKLFRLFVECCAADARPLSIPIDFGKSPPEYEELGWVKVIGKLHYAEEEGDIIPLIQVESMEPTAEPMDMMMY